MNLQTTDQGTTVRESSHTRTMRERVRIRTVELALIAGRGPHHIRQSDYEQAKRELTGEADFDRQQALLNDRG